MRAKILLFAVLIATALPATAHAEKIVRETFGCVSADDVWAAIRFYNEGQKAEGQAFITARMRAGLCVPLELGTPVAVIERGWTGLSKLQPAAGGPAVWAQSEAAR